MVFSPFASHYKELIYIGQYDKKDQILLVKLKGFMFSFIFKLHFAIKTHDKRQAALKKNVLHSRIIKGMPEVLYTSISKLDLPGTTLSVVLVIFDGMVSCTSLS